VVGAAAVVLVASLSACNPLPLTPQPWLPGASETTAWYEGPPEAWVEVQVVGADDVLTVVSSSVMVHDGVDRWCMAENQVDVIPCPWSGPWAFSPYAWTGGTPSENWVRTITVWPGEAVHIGIGCSHAGTPTDCPETMRVIVRTVGWDGALVGDVASAPPIPTPVP
jgi:hypothetical protein